MVALPTILAIILALVGTLPYTIHKLSPITPQTLTFPPLRSLPPDTTVYLEKQDIQRLASNQINGPEDVLVDQTHTYIYTGLSDGRVIRIHIETEQVETLFYTGMVNQSNVQYYGLEAGLNNTYCDFSYQREPICGRPLGLAWYADDSSTLLVIDPYHGLIQWNLHTQIPQAIHISITNNQSDGGGSSDDIIERIGLGNALTVDSSTGDIYITDTTSKYQRRDIGAAVLEGAADGRLWRYNYKTHHTEVVLRDLIFPNGIIYHYPQDALYFASTNTATIHRYYLYGSKKGIHDIYIKDLQCLPDNLSWDESTSAYDTFWIGCSTKRALPFSLIDLGARYPVIRSLIALLFQPFGINQYFKFLPRVGIFIHASISSSINHHHHHDDPIVHTYVDNTGNLMFISHALRVGSHVYIGSVREDIQWISRVTHSPLLKNNT